MCSRLRSRGYPLEVCQDWKPAVALRRHLGPHHQSPHLSWMARMPIRLASPSIKVMGSCSISALSKQLSSLSIAFLHGFNLLPVPWHIGRRKSVFSVTFPFSGWVCTKTSLLWLGQCRLAQKTRDLIPAISCLTWLSCFPHTPRGSWHAAPSERGTWHLFSHDLFHLLCEVCDPSRRKYCKITPFNAGTILEMHFICYYYLFFLLDSKLFDDKNCTSVVILIAITTKISMDCIIWAGHWAKCFLCIMS